MYHRMTLIIIIYTFLYCHKFVTLEAVAEQVRSRQSLSVIMSQVIQVSYKRRFKNCQWGTVKYCPRKWVPDCRCRVMEASCCEDRWTFIQGYVLRLKII